MQVQCLEAWFLLRIQIMTICLNVEKHSGIINVNVLSTYIQKTAFMRLLNQCALFLFFKVIFITISQAIAHPAMRTTYVPRLKYQI